MVVGAAVMALAGGHAIGQTVGPPATGPNTAVAGNAAASNLPFGVPEILKLCQAKVSEGTVVAFVQNSGDSYNLNADQIVWLRQQGVSDAILTAMLSRPRAGAVPSPAYAPAPPPIAPPAYQPAYPTAAAPYLASADSAAVDNSAYAQPVYDYSEPYYYPSPFYWGGMLLCTGILLRILWPRWISLRVWRQSRWSLWGPVWRSNWLPWRHRLSRRSSWWWVRRWRRPWGWKCRSWCGRRTAVTEMNSKCRPKNALTAKALRAAGLVPVDFVGSALTARFGDARTSRPRPQSKSLAAGPLSIFRQALRDCVRGSALIRAGAERPTTATRPGRGA